MPQTQVLALTHSQINHISLQAYLIMVLPAHSYAVCLGGIRMKFHEFLEAWLESHRVEADGKFKNQGYITS